MLFKQTMLDLEVVFLPRMLSNLIVSPRAFSTLVFYLFLNTNQPTNQLIRYFLSVPRQATKSLGLSPTVSLAK